MKLYICDYQLPRSNEVDCFIIEAKDHRTAERTAIDELKTLNIPKRYLIRVEEVL